MYMLADLSGCSGDVDLIALLLRGGLWGLVLLYVVGDAHVKGHIIAKNILEK